jgi:hypothetical protein
MKYKGEFCKKCIWVKDCGVQCNNTQCFENRIEKKPIKVEDKQ